MIKKFIQKLFDIHPNAMSFQGTFDLTGLPIITFYQGENKFNFLLDTGANDNVIDSNALSSINHEVASYRGTLTGLDGIKNEVTACNITFSYKTSTFPFTYLVKDMSAPFSMLKNEYGVNLHGILGSRFFDKFKYVLDFESLTAYSKV